MEALENSTAEIENSNKIMHSASLPIRLMGSSKKKEYISEKKKNRSCSLWVTFSYILTFWALPPLLSWMGGMKDASSQRAFREKVSLCFVIFCLCGIVAFLTFFLPTLMCPIRPEEFDSIIKFQEANSGTNFIWAYGRVYNSTLVSSFFLNLQIPAKGDISFLFPNKGKCGTLSNKTPNVFYRNDLENMFMSSSSRLEFDWDDLLTAPGKLVVLNGIVINITNSNFSQLIDTGADASLFFTNRELMGDIDCLIMNFKVGIISKDTPGCFLAKVILLLSLFTVIFVVILRFVMAVVFNWFLSNRISPKNKKSDPYIRQKSSATRLASILPTMSGNTSVYFSSSNTSSSSKLFTNITSDQKENIETIHQNRILSLISSNINQSTTSIPTTKIRSQDDMYVLLLVTCYSEGIDAIRTTLDSLAESEYPDGKKLLFVVSDGLVVGSGNSLSTPDILLSLIKEPICFQFSPSTNEPTNVPLSYDSIGEGVRAINGTLLYAGTYTSSLNPTTVAIPIILIVKTGSPDLESESLTSSSKPGNRGKRDSQVSNV